MLLPKFHSLAQKSLMLETKFQFQIESQYLK